MLTSPSLKLRDDVSAGSLRSGEFFDFSSTFGESSSTLDRNDFVDYRLQEPVSDIGKSLKLRRAAMKGVLSEYTMYFSLDFRASLIKQIDILLDEEDWMPGDALPSVNSFRALLRALVLLDSKKRPGLGVTSDGNVLGMWSNDSARISLEFIAGDLVRWTGSNKIGTPDDQIACRTATVRLSDALSGFGVRGLIDGA